MLIKWEFHNLKKLKINFLFYKICILFFILRLINGIAHDSLKCRKFKNCSDASHIILRLYKRDDDFAHFFASKYDMQIKGDSFLDGSYFLYPKNKKNKTRKKRSAEVVDSMKSHPYVIDVVTNVPHIRTKRDFIQQSEIYGPSQKKKRSLDQSLNISKFSFSDPLYNNQWYLVGHAVNGFDINVREAWLLGYSGRNVSISILDDGIQRNHSDLFINYDPLASTDVNDHDDDPTPLNNEYNKHGTRCAGEIAAIAGNGICGVGVAFNAKIGGVRMLDGSVSDSVEAASLSLNQNHIDIYSASWGPEDDGKIFDGPGKLAQEAFYRGIKTGRRGLGNIFVWASGNGGSKQDSCSADGYTTSIYTLSISSATYNNLQPWYLEECPSTIATTYSSANLNEPAIVTVDVPDGCTTSHTGTSASAPLAAGIIALALEANPFLSWRDTQHIVLRTANPIPLLNNSGWSKNGVGRWISNKFGYGLMDAGALVKLAKIWRPVPEQLSCKYIYKFDKQNFRMLHGNFQSNFSLEVNGCNGSVPILYLEHVQVITTISLKKRGDLKLTLFSPSGTRSVLLPPRPRDINTDIYEWPFLSVQMWGEDPRGIWTFMLESVTNDQYFTGTFHGWTLVLYGTEDQAQPNDKKHPINSISMGSRISSIISQNSSITETNELFNIFSNVPSSKNCHEQCIGCSKPQSATSCFKCKHFTQALRNRSGFKCVKHCDSGFYNENDKCKRCNLNCNTCNMRADHCKSCHGLKLLIEVDINHGKCVDECPKGFVSDYSNFYQARCITKKNRCLDGFYEDNYFNCIKCNIACKLCHGPGAYQCDSCGVGYSNISTGYCQLCCNKKWKNNLKIDLTLQQKSFLNDCVDCNDDNLSNNFKFFKNYSKMNSIFMISHFTLAFLSIFFILILCIYCWVKCKNNKMIISKNNNNDKSTNMEYTPLNNEEYDLDRIKNKF